MAAPTEVLSLVERFDRNYDSYRSAAYNETQLRREFLDPLFAALGWDVDNRAGYAEAFKDVIHEDALRIGSAHEAPDYCFRIGGTRKFFVEAKKPAINIKDDVKSAYQLRRYAWSAKLPLSILTDFEEFAIYDCRIKPAHLESASTARIFYCTYKDYSAQWDFISGIFARESILKGAFDKYAEGTRGKKGTAEVDDAFLRTIESWRELLARNLAIRNEKISERDLNFAVTRVLDRLIFLRICEDRGVEPYEQLKALCNGDAIYRRLFETLFRHADERFNSGLFHFTKDPDRHELPDELTPTLEVDDDLLRKIIRAMYYPESPYEFSVIPADILGHVYERFLGNVIRLTAGHQAKVDEKPEVRKAGGVYYTPTHIVDYIVANTVGKLLDGKTPKEAAKLKIVDPACGSGSFLLQAYQYLLDWHLAYYTAHAPDGYLRQKNPPIYELPSLPIAAGECGGAGATPSQSAPRSFRLTTSERKRILLANVHGVDIDPQAVEVTKLSLLLKVLEGENQATLDRQYRFFRERALPDLADNIKCGNSLIGYDFYSDPENQQLSLDEKLRVNVFDWKESFPHIFKAKNDEDRGFDAVIGNPPYIDSEWMTDRLPHERGYMPRHYAAASGNWDIFCVFVEKALELSRAGGLCSMIVPNKLGSANYASGARGVLTARRLLSIRDYSRVRVFPVAVYPIVYVVLNAPPADDEPVLYERMLLAPGNGIRSIERRELDRRKYFADPQRPWAIFGSVGTNGVAQRMADAFRPLGQLADVCGAATVAEAYEIQALIRDKPALEKDDLGVINSGTIDRYVSLWGQERLRYLGDSYLHPAIPAALQRRLPATRRSQAHRPKLIVAGMTRMLECTADMEGRILAGKSTSVIFSQTDLRYLLGLLNSRLINYYFTAIYGGNALQGGYLRIGPPQLRTIPIRPVDLSKKSDKSRHDKMISLVAQMLALHKVRSSSRTDHEREALSRQINAIDRQIDDLVYNLYCLTDDEIRIVNEANAR